MTQRDLTETLPNGLVRMPVLWPRNGPVGVLDEDEGGKSTFDSLTLTLSRSGIGCFSNWFHVPDFSKVEPDGWVTVHVGALVA